MATTRARTWLAAAAAVGAVIVGGCNDGGQGDVASLESAGPSGEASGSGDATASAQRQGAEAFYACLTDAGLPAVLNPVDDSDNGDAAVGWETDHTVMERIPGQFSGVSGGEGGAASQEDADAFFAQGEDTYGLVVDGVDHTAQYQQCHESSGYVQPEYPRDPAEEAKQRQASVDATNEWIACARENGYPDLADVQVSSTEPDQWPQATLPLSTTADQLRALLEVCPNFDEDQAREMMSGEATTQDWTVQPSIGFEQPSSDDADSDSDAQFNHLSELVEILYEKQQAFYESQADSGSGSSIRIGS
ncbi:MAG: hypothetical protein LBK59_07635 [Bifidobacteriaceae bacterium]|jgi:hypothetical protein|nr:hypothetical protein [Bifidobacteriaceae bacterium]